VSAFALHGRLLLDGALRPGAIVVDGDRIVDVQLPARDLPADARAVPIVAPGCIDLQVNGAFGHECAGDPGAYDAIARALPATGTTSWLPTLVTSPRAEYDAAFAALRAAPSSPGRAEPLGFHLEGPLLAPAKKGAHRDAPMAQDAGVLDALAASGLVRLATLAPVRPGAVDAIRALRARGVVVSIGHTAGTADDAARAADAGATLVTHLYNAMSPFAARAPGVVGAALVDDRLTCCLIADLVHADRAALELAVRAKGAARIVLVTDAMSAAGRGPGRYSLGGLDVIVDATSARLPDGTLAGSVLTMDVAVRNAATTSLGAAGALAAASEQPARVLGLADRGRLVVGARADVACWDDGLRLVGVYVGGARVA
jgi:N-acetylglucosamine-6-phosphate deacetylase